jgi:hypothetical protein
MFEITIVPKPGTGGQFEQPKYILRAWAEPARDMAIAITAKVLRNCVHLVIGCWSRVRGVRGGCI